MTNTKTSVALASVLALALQLSGCASTRSEQVAKEGAQSLQREVQRLDRPSVVTQSDQPYVAALRVDYVEPPKEGTIQLVASSVELGKLLDPLATTLGYSVQFLVGTNPDQRVTLSHRNIAALSAVRELAFAAGYVAVIDERTRTIRIADTAQFTFRVPAHVTAPSAPATKMTFTASSNMPTSSTGGSTGGASGAASTGMGNATVTTSTDPSKGFKAYLQGLLGESAQINVIQEAGVVTVRGKGYQLLRARDFLERYVAEGMRQVNLEVSVVEVSLLNEFEFGVDWAKVVPLNRIGSAAVQMNNAGRVNDPAMTVGITTNSITSVVKALENRTSVRVLSAPRLMLTNNMPALYKKVTNRPYVPSVTSTTTGSSALGGSVTASATAANIPEGTVLTAIGNVVDNGNVWISLLAQSVDVTGFQSFSPTKDTLLTVPIAPTTELPVSILAESGKTVVVAGQRARRESKTGGGVPFSQDLPIPFVRELLSGVKDVDSASEVFILVNATVLPAPKVDVQIAESI